MKTESWSPQPAAVTQVVTGQAQAKFNPSAVAGSPYFVSYTWTTAGVWYSPDGTPGTFEPFGGNYAVGWQQGQATTQFTAQFFDAGQYLLEVQCVANVYSVYNGSLIASFTNTGYIGGDASDIDTGGGNAPHAQRARALRPNAAMMGAGITIVPATVTFSPNSLIKLGLGSPKDYFKVITATVAPANQASNVTFGASNGEVAVNSSSNPATGVVTLTVTAVSETPATTQGASDCNITASFDNPNPLSPTPPTVPVLVLTPSYIKEPFPSGTYSEIPQRFVISQTSIPPADNVPAGLGVEGVLYNTTMTYTLQDQFHNPLDPIYAGAAVSEDSSIGTHVSVGGDGTFTDSVGGFAQIGMISSCSELC